MKDLDLAPDPHLMESMRAVGYTLETAVADIIDNSITARADQIDVLFSADPEACLAIVDNGYGMDETTLIRAMQLAARPPTDTRQTHDLGRFGLGLKTASLSQARSVTVATRQGGPAKAVRWDLDHLGRSKRWALQVLDEREIARLPWIERLLAHDRGTQVVWQNLDQLHATPDLVESHLDTEMAGVRDHLALVFHRFTGSVVPPLERRLILRINGSDVPTVDPFLTTNKATQVGQQESIRVAGETVTVQPYTLPYVSKLRPAERQAAQIAGTFRDSQGFYIYRSGRLLQWGTWFRIIPRDELGKLARVRVDIPNSLDHLWALDIKKSAAVPPPDVRRRLTQLADQIIGPSRRTHTYRGRSNSGDSLSRLWTLIDDRGSFRYELNRSHPLVQAVYDHADPATQTTLSHLLRTIEASFPVEDAYNRLGADGEHRPRPVGTDELVAMARTMRDITRLGATDLAQRLALVEPFAAVDNLEAFLKESLSD